MKIGNKYSFDSQHEQSIEVENKEVRILAGKAKVEVQKTGDNIDHVIFTADGPYGFSLWKFLLGLIVFSLLPFPKDKKSENEEESS